EVLARRAALHAGDDRLHGLDQRRVLAVRLVGAAPALVAGDADAGREVPRDAGGAHLVGGDRARLLGELRVAARTDADVVRHDRRADDVVVAVHRVHAVDQRDLEAGRLRAQLVGVHHLRPGLGRV